MSVNISKPGKRPGIFTLCGDAGVGKSGLAAMFPNPIFIRAEDGVGRISKSIEVPDSFDPVKWPDKENKTPDDLWAQLLWLLQKEHDYKTLVVDSVSKLDEVFIQSVLERDGKARGINQAFGGYGAGAAAVAADHRRVRKAAGLLNERRGMNVIFIAHADLETMKLPDRDDYQRYSLRLLKNSIPPYVDDVDFVGFIRLQSALRGDDDERKKVVSNGDRELICYATAASVSKNGFGITDALDFEEGANPLAPYLEAGAKPKPKPAKPPKEEEVDPSDFEGESQ